MLSLLLLWYLGCGISGGIWGMRGIWDGIWEYEKGIWDMSGRYLGGVWEVSGRYLGDIWEVSGTYLRGISATWAPRVS